jgi:hypothetical protein
LKVGDPATVPVVSDRYFDDIGAVATSDDRTGVTLSSKVRAVAVSPESVGPVDLRISDRVARKCEPSVPPFAARSSDAVLS